MAAPQGWAEWLSGLLASLWQPQRPPAPGTHEAHTEEVRRGALLNKELSKPSDCRDEELVHKLRADYRRLELANKQAKVRKFKQIAARWDISPRQCCAAAQWAVQRMAASYRVRAAFYEQVSQQIEEELAAAEARRKPAIVIQPTLHLDLPAALRQAPQRMDMCRKCADMLSAAAAFEEGCRAYGEFLCRKFQERGMLQAVPHAAAASVGVHVGAAAAAATATAAAGPPAGEAQPGQRPPSQPPMPPPPPPPLSPPQQQQQQQKHSAGSRGGGEDAPPTPRQPPVPQLQQHSSSDEEQR